MPIVCGIHPVLEALAAGSRTIERVVVTKGVRNKRILEVIKRASERGVPLRFEPREALDRASDGERHQGVLAIVAEKGLLSLEELQKTARTPALFMLLDGVEDPRNLGAIIRSVDAAGADGVILPDRHTASLSDAASRTAAGALESVKIARIGNVVQAIEALKAKGFWIVGFDGSGKERWDAIDYKRPIVLVLGGEGKGIRRLVKENCDHVVSLPVFGQVSSLNVSVAAGIALYEAVRQRGTVPTLARPIPPRALAAKKTVVIGPPPDDREEDPGARRRAAALASLAAVQEAAPPPAMIVLGHALSLPATDHSSTNPVREAGTPVAEALVEPISTPVESGLEDGQVAPIALATDAQGDERDDEDIDEDPDEVASDGDADEDDTDGVDDDEADDDTDDEDDDEDDDDYDEEEDDEEDDEVEDEEDDDDDDDDDEDPGDVASDLAAPFMPEDNSGGGEVTWGSEKELRVHRPRREGERRFGKGGRRSGRPNDNRKTPKPQEGAATAPQKPRPQGQGQPQAGEQGRGQNQKRNRNRKRNQQRRGPGSNQGESPLQKGGSPGEDQTPNRGNTAPRDSPSSQGEPADRSLPRNGQGEQGTQAPRDPNRPDRGRDRNRRRRGGRGRKGAPGRPAGTGDVPQGDPNASQGQPERGGAEPRGERASDDRVRSPKPPQQGEVPVGVAGPRPEGDRSPKEGDGSERGRRDRDRRRRRRGRRGPGGGGSGSRNGGSGDGGATGSNGGSGGANGGGSDGGGSAPSGGSASE